MTRFFRASAFALGLVCTASCARAPEAPETLGIETDADLEGRFGCLDVIAMQETTGAFKVLVFKLPKASESDSDYRLVFYRKDGAVYRRYGAQQNLVNFRRPILVGGERPRIETVENRLGVRFYYRVSADDVQLVPAEAVR